ncbi:MAG: hypothetical protein AB7T86_01175 [Xanthobacteraceae bacterium]|jgi:hypothetical protein|uniref:hypothetical protein n=1 Tax=Pseudolabrys sp. TaxID=1960880 RepID=UPI003D12348B
MDVKPISVIAIKPSVDSGGRGRSPQQFDDAEQKDDRDDDEQFSEQVSDDAFDMPLTDAPDLAPELPAPPKPGRYINKVV